MSNVYPENLDTMTPAEFEAFLPELFESGTGNISSDPRFATFFEKNPDCAALVRDLEAIAQAAKSLFDPPSNGESEGDMEPSDNIWSNIASKLQEPTSTEDEN